MIMRPKTAEKIAKFVIWFVSILVVLLLFFIVGFILFKGIPTLTWDFLTQDPTESGRSGGIFSTIVSTLLVTLVAVLVATPFGVGTAFYLTEFTHENKVTRIIRFSAESLAAIPSIVYGLFGFIFFVIYLKLGWSIISGGLTMGVMILPTIIRTSEEAIRTVPKTYREVSFSLGGNKWQTITRAVLPSAFPGIATGVILGIGRCVAETAAVILTAGSSLHMPESLFDPSRTMAVHFYILAREGISMERAYGTATLLIIIILFINLSANMIVNRFVANSK
jgi:phosphate transport system permease protein